MIPGIASQTEQQLLDQLAEIRKASGEDGGDPATAAVHALDRLARAGMSSGKTFGESYDAVLRTQQGSQLYSVSKSQGGTVVTDAAAALAHIRNIAS